MIRIGRCRARAASGEADVPLPSVAMNVRVAILSTIAPAVGNYPKII
jgi:hypothetical protein